MYCTCSELFSNQLFENEKGKREKREGEGVNHLHSQFATNNRIKTIKFLPQTTEKKVVYDTKNVRTRETLVIKLLLLEKNGKIALVRTNTLQNCNIYFVFSHRVRNISNINVSSVLDLGQSTKTVDTRQHNKSIT